jgi:hypothetical protein
MVSPKGLPEEVPTFNIDLPSLERKQWTAIKLIKFKCFKKLRAILI